MASQEDRFNSLSPKIKEFIKENLYVKSWKDQYDCEHKKLTSKKGLFLFGITGSGKTYSLETMSELYSLPVVHNWVEMLFDLKDKMNTGNVKNYLDVITERDFVFIDDVGAEKSTEWVQEVIYLIIDRCYRNKKTLMLTTNLTQEDFAKRYGERILSRLVEMCEMITMEEQDHRLEK